MDMPTAKETFLQLINELIEFNDFDSFVQYDRTRDGFKEWYDSHPEVMEAHPNLFFSQGETRAVIGAEDYGYVIKIPFDKYNNYCEREIDNFKKSEAAGLSDCFAFCDKLTSFRCGGQSVTVSIMEFAEHNEDRFSDFVYETHPEIFDDYEDCLGDEDCVVSVLTAEWENTIDSDELLDFLDERQINDLHSGNVGIIGGALVLIDYSGYGF